MTSHSSHRPVSALRARMIEDMRVRGFSEKTRNDYIRNVRAFAAFIGRSPDTAMAEDLRRCTPRVRGGARSSAWMPRTYSSLATEPANATRRTSICQPLS
jgi:hypothetical protein